MVLKMGILFIISAVMWTVQAQTPYAVFGHKTNVFYDANPNFYWQLKNSDLISNNTYVEFQPSENRILYLNEEGFIVDVINLSPEHVFRFLGTDPMEQSYPSMGPYTFVANTPINALDPDGRLIIFVNGYHTSPLLPTIIPPYSAFLNPLIKSINDYTAVNVGFFDKKGYWDQAFISAAQDFFKDNHAQYMDGSGDVLSSGQDRFNSGYDYAKKHFDEIVSEIMDENGVQKEVVTIVSQSMGAAYSEGVVKYLEERKIKVSTVVHLSAVNTGDFKASKNPLTIQLNYENDGTIGLLNLGDNNVIQGVDLFGEVKTNLPFTTQFFDSHGRTKKNPNVFKDLDDLMNIQFNFVANKDKAVIGAGAYTTKVGEYMNLGNCFGTEFNKVVKNGDTYSRHVLDMSKYYQGPAR